MPLRFEKYADRYFGGAFSLPLQNRRFNLAAMNRSRVVHASALSSTAGTTPECAEFAYLIEFGNGRAFATVDDHWQIPGGCSEKDFEAGFEIKASAAHEEIRQR